MKIRSCHAPHLSSEKEVSICQLFLACYVAVQIKNCLKSTSVIQSFEIEFIGFTVDFVQFAVEFVAFAIEFGLFAIQFISFAIEFVGFAVEFSTLALEFVAFAHKFVTVTLAATNQLLITR